MKKSLSILIVIIFVFVLNFSAYATIKNTSKPSKRNPKTTAKAKLSSTLKTFYKDGTYEAKSNITSEGYYGKAKITISKGLISNVYFQIFDTGIFKLPEFNKKIANYKNIKELPVDEKYGPTVYYNNAGYKQQCVNELAGIKKYKKALIDTQNINKVDTISGATWSHLIFKDSVSNALKKAKK